MTSGVTVGRQYSLVGDAELDEGAVWEAIGDPMVSGLGEIVWIVDLNRQSLDRVVPALGTPRLQGMFAAAGWQVITVKYGDLLESLFREPGGAALRERIDAMPNPEYQRLLRCTPSSSARGFRPATRRSGNCSSSLDDPTLTRAIRNLGGHDFTALNQAFAEIDDTRPTVIFAYTVKGHGLAVEGHPQNHSSLLDRGAARRTGRTGRRRPGRPLGGLPRRLARGAVLRRGQRRPEAPAGRHDAPAPGPDRLRPHPVGHRRPPRRRWAGPCST